MVSETSGFYALTLVEGDSLLKRETMHSTGNTLSFDLPITTESMPNVTVSVLFLKNDTLYQATKVIKVPPTQQRLQVDITPAKDIFQPQQTVAYDVLTRDASGKPVSAEVAVGVVDEAIYSLYPDISGDMVNVLYPRRFLEAHGRYFAQLLLQWRGRRQVASVGDAQRPLPSPTDAGEAGERSQAARPQGFFPIPLIGLRKFIPMRRATGMYRSPSPTRSPPGGQRSMRSHLTAKQAAPSIACWCARMSFFAWARHALW